MFSSSTPAEQLSSGALEIEAQIKAVGDAVRNLKSQDEVDKEAVSEKVAELKTLKTSFEAAAGRPFDVQKKKVRSNLSQLEPTKPLKINNDVRACLSTMSPTNNERV